MPIAENVRDERAVVASGIIHKSIEEAIEVPLQMNTDKGTTIFKILFDRCARLENACKVEFYDTLKKTIFAPLASS